MLVDPAFKRDLWAWLAWTIVGAAVAGLLTWALLTLFPAPPNGPEYRVLPEGSCP